MTIHKEGRTLLLVMLVILAGVVYLGFHLWGSIPLVSYGILTVALGFYLIVLQFFRNPIFQPPQDGQLAFAPADGKVVVIEEAEEDEYLREKRLQVSIFMSPVNVHVNRSPIKGEVKYYKYHPGKYLVAWHPKSSTENERTTVVLEHENGTTLLMRQIAGALARRIKCYVDKGDKLEQGGEFGFIKFGSRVDLYLPLGSEILVGIDQKTKGGRTPIARLPQ